MIAELGQHTPEFNKWQLSSASSESEAISNNYVSATKDSGGVSFHVKDVQKNHQLSLLQKKIQQQIPKESKFFDEFEGSELKFCSTYTLFEREEEEGTRPSRLDNTSTQKIAFMLFMAII